MKYIKQFQAGTTTKITTAVLLAILYAVPQSDGFVTFPSAAARHKRIALDAGRSHAHVLESTSQEPRVASTNTSPSSPSDTNDYDPSDALIRYLEETHPAERQRDRVSEVTTSHSTADNIVRDLDGNSLSKEYFARTMGVANVESYVCRDAFRDFMSNACRVHLLPGGETAFYKRIHFESLDHAKEKLKTAPFKLHRDAKSYQVVASFLSSDACQTMKDRTGVCIPELYDVRSEPDYDNPIKSKFSFLFQDLAPADGWYQEWLLTDIESCEATLSTLAKIHAFFWNGSDFWKDHKDAAVELEAAVWKSGSYVQPIAQGAHQWKEVASEWATKKLRFETELSSKGYWDNLGERLQSVAEDCGILAHPFAYDDDSVLCDEYKKYRTFTHGDPKQANLLFRRNTSTNESSKSKPSSKLQLGLIDFQWSGFGLAATDIAHFLTSAVHADMLVDDGEEFLMRYYYDELQKYLVEFGACRTSEEARQHYSYDTYVDQYEIAVLDLCRLVTAYTWDRFTEAVEKDDREGCARTMNKTSYNKSIANTIWLMTKCDELLTSRGV
jgi:thiamine kinase-like enzyme